MIVPLTPEQAVTIGRLCEPFVPGDHLSFAVEFHVHSDRVTLTIGDSVYEIQDDGTDLLVETRAAV